MKTLVMGISLLINCFAYAQLVSRHYIDGSTLIYQISNTQEINSFPRAEYQGLSKVVMKTDHEEWTWQEIFLNKSQFEIPPDFVQIVTLIPSQPQQFMQLPEPEMRIGPTLDTLNFYANGLVAMKQENLRVAGDRAFIPDNGNSNRWTDPGKNIVLGQDCLDFDVELAQVNDETVTFKVDNIPPIQGCKDGPPSGWEWMITNLSGQKNNFFQITKLPSGRYAGMAGSETVKTVLLIDRKSGKINSATMINPVNATMWECDPNGTNCNAGQQISIVRRTELKNNN